MMDCTIALAQIDPAVGNLGKNVEKHVAAAEKARAEGAALVVFPELSLTGYSIRDMNWDLAFSTAAPPRELAPLLDLSRAIPMIVGGVEEGQEFGLYNAAFLIEDGTIRSVHRKVYPPTYGMFEEMRYFSPGRTVRAFDTKIGRIGVLICEDFWHLSLPYLHALDGAELIVSMVASPTRLGGSGEEFAPAAVNTENHIVFARLLSVYIAFCHRVGFEDGIHFWGGSTLIGPAGRQLASAKLFEEDLICGRVESNEVRRARRFSRHMLDEDPRLVLQELRRLAGASRADE